MQLIQEYTLAHSLAQEAGKIMLEHFGINKPFERKEDSSEVTAADVAIDTLVTRALGEAFPQDTILSEELGVRAGSSGRSWVIDPMDGTSNFAHGVPLAMFSLALTVEGVPVLSFCLDPFMSRLFSAEKGKGAFLNGQPIHVSTATSLTNEIVHHEIAPRPWLPDASEIPGRLRGMRAKRPSYSCTVYGACMVAAGGFIGSINATAKPWDVAAVALLVQEAGGKVTSLEGEDQSYDAELRGCLLTNGILHDELLRLIA